MTDKELVEKCYREIRDKTVTADCPSLYTVLELAIPIIWPEGYEVGKSFATINLPDLIKEAEKAERERIINSVINLLKRTTDYKLMVRMRSGRYFQSVAHDSEWDEFGQTLKGETNDR